MAASDETKPLFASNWHGELNLDQLRQEIEYIYAILREGGLTPPTPVTPPAAIESTESGTGVPLPVTYGASTVTYSGSTVTYA
jgi:hypothetical protein